MLILLTVSQLPNLGYNPTVPNIFRIDHIRHTDTNNRMTYESYVVISNTDSKDYLSRHLRVNTYINGNPANCKIPTLNNDLFCRSDHTGVYQLWGVGTQGNRDSRLSVWPAHSDIAIEYNHGTLHPGDQLTLEFIDTTTDQVISRDTYPHTDENQEKLMQLYFSYQGA